MGQRSKITSLPQDLRDELDRRLISSGFANYVALEDWLAEHGQQIGKSSIHRYGTGLEERINSIKIATEQAKAIVDASPDEGGDMTEALMRLMQEKLFTLLLEINIDAEDANLGAIAKAMAPLARASIAIKKYQSETRDKVKAKLDEIAAQAGAGTRPGLTAEALRQIREEIYGVV